MSEAESHLSGASSFSDYRYDVVHLPPAGLSSGRLKHHWSKQALGSKGPPDFSLIQMKAGPNKTPPGQHLDGLHSRVDPSDFHEAAGSKSEKVQHIGNHGTSHDWEDNLPKKKGHIRDKPSRADEMKGALFPVQPRGKATFSIYGDAATDPITHFRHQGGVVEAKWRPARRTGYANEAATQTWTWAQSKEALENMPKPTREQTKTEQKIQVSVRGERNYNVCGTEDLLPAATEDFIKCDVPPTRAHIVANDKKYLPYCARQGHTPRPMKEYNQSHQVWDCMLFDTKDGAGNETASRIGDDRDVSPGPSYNRDVSPGPSYMQPLQRTPRSMRGDPDARSYDDDGITPSAASYANVTPRGSNVTPRSVTPRNVRSSTPRGSRSGNNPMTTPRGSGARDTTPRGMRRSASQIVLPDGRAGTPPRNLTPRGSMSRKNSQPVLSQPAWR